MRKTKRMTVVATVPFGFYKGDFNIRVLEGGMSLELTVAWPTPMIDSSVLHQKWPRPCGTEATPMFTVYLRAVLALEKALKKRSGKNQ